MHDTLVRAFERELTSLRETATEFGHAYPDLAPHIAGGKGNPHIERLLEGVAFLAARTAIRVDAEYERLAQDLVQAVAPDLLCSLPPAALVQFKPLLTLSTETPTLVPRDSAIRYQQPDGTELHFRTAAEVRLRPIELAILPPPHRGEMARTLSPTGGINLPSDIYHATVVRATLRAVPGRRLAEVLDRSLDLHCCGPHAAWLWRFLSHPALMLVLVDPQTGIVHAVHRQGALRPVGWSDAEALLPLECALPGPLRLLREAHAWPERFLRLALDDLPSSLERWFGDAIELWWLAADHEPAPALAPEALRPFCCPVVALTQRRCEPLIVGDDGHEGVVRLPAGAIEQEIVAIDRVELRYASGVIKRLAPLSHLESGLSGKEQPGYALRRQPRWHADGEHRAPRAATDWLIAPSLLLGDGDMLLVTAWASQRIDQLRPDDARSWRLDAVAGVRDIVGIGGPITPPAQATLAPETLLRLLSWRLDRLNGLEPAALAAALSEWLRLFCRSERMPTMLVATLTSDVEMVAGAAVPVHARGWKLTVGVDARTATTPVLCLWPHILAATLMRQLQAESFVRCQFVHDGNPVGEALAWR